MLTDDYAPLVFINTVDGKAAQLFTIACELAHVWFARSAAVRLSGSICGGIPCRLLLLRGHDVDEVWVAEPRVRFP